MADGDLKKAAKGAAKGKAGAGEDAKIAPLKLSVGTAKISAGCYSISVSGGIKGAPIWLCLGGDKHTLDITNGYRKSNLAELLKLVDAGSNWGKTIDLYAVNAPGGKIEPKSKSAVVKTAMPVEPYKGKLSLEGIGKDKKLTYTGIKTGRMLHTTPVNGWHLIKYGGFAETDPKMRGLNCITYVGGAYKKETAMNAYGTQLAKALGAKKCKPEMECKFKDDVLAFFADKGKSGTYIMWSENHVVVVKNATVFEFCKSKNGFSKRAIASWGFQSKPYWVRKL